VRIMSTCPDFIVVDNASHTRYEARVQDGLPDAGRVIGVLRYERQDGRVVLPSTVTDPQYRGNGIASTLTQRALDDARAAGVRVQPDCWYVEGWIERHPEYADLRV
jgi:predicted GNAT family acetyltransferase